MDDPLQRKESLSAAFTPGPPVVTSEEDYLSTCALCVYPIKYKYPLSDFILGGFAVLASPRL
eukprot:8373213-Pyramimonas_sp.AAC.1